jgi:uncharacterized protein (TIGR02118 family)
MHYAGGLAAEKRSPPGLQLTMIKLVYCISRKTGLTDQQFFDHWKNVHGPIGSRIPRLRKLVQSHRLIIPGDQRHPEPKYDGMAELWFDDAQALLAAGQSPEWAASHGDEANFIDHTKVAYFVSEEHIILGEATP